MFKYIRVYIKRSNYILKGLTINKFPISNKNSVFFTELSTQQVKSSLYLGKGNLTIELNSILKILTLIR